MAPARSWREAQITPWTTSAAGLHSGCRASMATRRASSASKGRAPPTAAHRGGRRRAVTIPDPSWRWPTGTPPGRFDVAGAGEVVAHQEGALGLPAPFVAHAVSLPGPPGAVKAASKGNGP